jgi:cytochrome c peroxidase
MAVTRWGPFLLAAAMAGCGGSDSGGGAGIDPVDSQLRGLIARGQLTGNPVGARAIPDLDTPLAQLGMRLFFSRSLSGNFDVACASCHHPALAGADGLSLSVGVDATDPARLGPGRATADGAPNVPRNSPTTFNVALLDTVLFHDGRVEQLIAPGIQSAGIRTPDVPFGLADPDAGPNLAAAQARFPVTVEVEMRGDFLPGADNTALRDRLAERIGGYGAGTGELARNDWPALFEAAFGAGAATDLVTYDNIAAALSAYQRSQVFVDTSWNAYVAGDDGAIGAAAKRGAVLFLGRADEGGAGCGVCHRSDRFTDDAPHTVGFPQIGPGKGDSASGDDDLGRERESGDPNNRYEFRTASLLNVALTAPYGHAGAYATLTDVVRHYSAPQATANAYFANGGWCALAQFASLPALQCEALYPNAVAHTNNALQKVQQDRAGGAGIPPIQLDPAQVADIVAFLGTLTDPCAADPACVAPWVPPADGGPDDRQLEATFAP